jgi:exoribonuclease R
MSNPTMNTNMIYKININDRNYSSWSIFDANTLEPSTDIFSINFNPSDNQLFTGDIFTINSLNNGNNNDKISINIVHSSIRNNDNIPAVLILANNKTYGRRNGTKGKLLYKCVPDDMRLPAFLVPYEIKHMDFSKVFTNIYVTIRFNDWTDKHPIATISQNIGPIDVLDNYYEYQLYCKSLNSSIQKFTKDTNKAIETYIPTINHTNCNNTKSKNDKDTNKKGSTVINEKDVNDKNKADSRHDEFIETMCQKYPQIETRTNFNEWRIFTIDPRGSVDFDDAFSIKNVSPNTVLVSIYIANVTIWMDFLNLWSSFSQRISTIYLPDQKRPMLPTILSDCLCSLQAKTTRVAFVLDITIDTLSGEVLSTKYSNCSIKVFRNFIYEEPALLKNSDYTFLLDVTRILSKKYKYIQTVRNSHELVSYLMVFMNHHCAKELLQKRVGIFRSAVVKDTGMTVPIDDTKSNIIINEDVAKFIKIWNSSCGQYIDVSTLGENINTVIKHDLLEMDAYVHITSPIRRLVDLLNIIQLQNISGLIQLSINASDFYNNWIKKIDYINTTTRAIKKVQTDCLLLDLCYNNPEILEKEYDGYCFDKIVRNDGLFQFIVFLPELKIASRITTRENMANLEKRMYKLFLFKNEERFRKKIRFQLIH